MTTGWLGRVTRGYGMSVVPLARGHRTLVSVATDDLHDDDPLRIGDVQLVGRLGEGGMGVVYLGRDRAGNAVAVKVVKGAFAEAPDYRRRFADEVSAMRNLGGAYTAEVLAADIDGVPPWFVMEYVHGATLADHISRHGALPPAEGREFCVGLARAVAAMHRAGIVHRDLKPSNVVLSPSGPKLLDFGVAFGAAGDQDAGMRVGSLSWMAPEQLSGAAQGAACDVHAIAMLAYYAVCGRPVFGYGKGEAVAWRISNVDALLVDLPEDLLDMAVPLAAALSKQPADRPSAARMVTMLRGESVVDFALASPPPKAAGRSASTAAFAPAEVAPPPPPSAVPPVSVTATPPDSPLPITAAPDQLPATATPPPTEKPTRTRRGPLRNATLIAVTLWLVGWMLGGWSLLPWRSADVIAADSCLEVGAPADFADGTGFNSEGGGVAKNSWSGAFPGPFGEFRVPTHATACQIGEQVKVDCEQYTLSAAESISCTAVDKSRNERAVTISREGATWSWSLTQS